MITLENEFIKATVKEAGAELSSLYGKKTRINYLWNGDPNFWSRHSPVLFPIVGGLKNDSYNYKGKRYGLEKHGFARDSTFNEEHVTESSATFSLSDTPDTRFKYPFKFILKIHYSLSGDTLEVGYEVINPDMEILLFSIGAHPAFTVPFIENTRYEDYYLELDKEENAGIWPIEGNLIGGEAEPFLSNSKRINLKDELFYEDALVFKNLASAQVSLLNSKTENGITVRFSDFPYLGIWAAKNAPFVCIEPWCGIADSVNHNQEFSEKEGIIKLDGNSSRTVKWAIRCF